MTLTIDVSHIAGHPGTKLEFRRQAPVEGLQQPLGGAPETRPVSVEVDVEAVREGVAVIGSISGTLDLRCSKCLLEFEQGFSSEVDELFETQAGPEDETYPISGGEIDLEPMIRDLVVLATPVNPVHAEDCKGLCATCGADLNEIDCGHSAEPVDIRWVPLRELLDG